MRMTLNPNQSNFLKKAIQILLPISVLSFVVSQSSIRNGLLNVVYSNGAGSASSSIKFFEYKTERNCAFLLFNGLLALIIKNSGLKMTKPVDAIRPKPEEVISVREDKEDDECEQSNVDVVPDDVTEVISNDDDEEADEGVISVDELNRKCDDFIKKMRERIETDSDLHELQ